MQLKLVCYILNSVIKKVLESLKELKIKKLVLDPVMVAKGGAKLINDEAIKIFKKNLMKSSKFNYT